LVTVNDPSLKWQIQASSKQKEIGHNIYLVVKS